MCCHICLDQWLTYYSDLTLIIKFYIRKYVSPPGSQQKNLTEEVSSLSFPRSLFKLCPKVGGLVLVLF